MVTLWIVLRCPFTMFRRRHELAMEVLALRHQLMLLQRQTRRPKLRWSDRYLWLLLMRVWPHWRNPLIILQPDTLIKWQRAGFRMFWRWKSRRRPGNLKRLDRFFSHHRGVHGRLGATHLRAITD